MLLGKMFGGTIAEVMGRDAGKDLSEAIASAARNIIEAPFTAAQEVCFRNSP